jgi:hypothetical protein
MIRIVVPGIDGANSLKRLGPDIGDWSVEWFGYQTEPPQIWVSNPERPYTAHKPVGEGCRQPLMRNPPGREITFLESKGDHTRLPRIAWILS